jgi:hypothetical protein
MTSWRRNITVLVSRKNPSHADIKLRGMRTRDAYPDSVGERKRQGDSECAEITGLPGEKPDMFYALVFCVFGP